MTTATPALIPRPRLASRLIGLARSPGLQLRALRAALHCRLFGRYLFRDKFGLRYFIWSDTRLRDTFARGVRTDDEGVIHAVTGIAAKLAQSPSPVVAVDVGAYIGVITLAMASRLRPQDRLFSFEPVGRNHRRLRENLALNGCANVTALRKAVAEWPGRTRIALSHNPGGNFIDTDDPRFRARKLATGFYEEVEVSTLGEIARAGGFDRIDLLKTDAEFQDLNVLKGAGPLFETGRIRYVVSEYHPNEDSALIDHLTRHGYRVYYIVRRHAELVADLRDYPHQRARPCLNILAVSPHEVFDAASIGLTLRA